MRSADSATGRPPGREPVSIDALNLDYFVEWRQWAWSPAARRVLTPTDQFDGCRLLEIGSNNRRMSCLFALLGASVTAVEVDEQKVHATRAEAARWGLSEQITALRVVPDPASLPEGPFDFVFTKSVLVLVRDARGRYLEAIRERLTPGGALLALENLRGGPVHQGIRRLLHPTWENDVGFDEAFEADLRHHFRIVEARSTRGLVAAIRATT